MTDDISLDDWPERIGIPALEHVLKQLEFVTGCLSDDEDRQAVAIDKVGLAAKLVDEALLALKRR